MASVNRVTLVGYLGRDPEVRYTAGGMAVANVSLATSYARKNRDTGERTEETEWHRLVFMDRLAEVVGEHLRKGALCYVEGRLRTTKWQDKQGADRYTTEIVCDSMQMLGGRQQDDAQERPPAAPAPAPAARPPSQAPLTPPANAYAAATGRGQSAAPRPTPPPSPRQPTAFDDMDDDIPF